MTASPGAEKIPSHIPADRVWDGDFDRFTAELDDPFLAISRFHDGPDIFWATNAAYGRPGWVATRYDIISEIFMDHEHFSAERPGMIGELVGEPVKLNPIEIDPPAHFGYRRILNPFFSPKALRSFEDPVRNVCKELISKFADAGRCEFIHDFAIPFPSYVFLDLLALPREKLADFIDWEDKLMRAPDPMERVKAAREIYGYLKQHLEREKADPSNDLTRGITTGEFEGRPLDYYEMMGMFYVLYVGGLDTVYSTLGWTMRHLATHPDLQQRLRNDPSLISQAVEEFARAFSVVITHREVRSDLEFHGVQMHKGEEIHMPLALGDRDPRAFPDPHTVDIDRQSRHIAFGTGVHNCIGIHLAKREIRIVIEEFLKNFSNIRIPDGEQYKYHTGRTLGVDYLPLEWDRA